MKLIIDIDEKIFNKSQNGELTDFDSMYICGKVSDGIPLDNIRAEINALSEYHWDKGDFDIDVVNGMINEFLNIIDRHIRGEEC